MQGYRNELKRQGRGAGAATNFVSPRVREPDGGMQREGKLDRELYRYILDEQNEIDNPINVTIIYNRLDDIGNLYNPKYGFWGMNYVNLHFHGTICFCAYVVVCFWFDLFVCVWR